MESKMSQEKIMQLLDKLYEQSVQGIAKVSPPIEELANDYLKKSKDVDVAARSSSAIKLRNAQLLAL